MPHPTAPELTTSTSWPRRRSSTTWAASCSICAKSGYLHLVVPASQFQLLSGAEHLTSYQFNTGTAKHLFCAVCGVKSFYVPRSKPDGFSINARCLDAGTFSALRVTAFDGQQWEQQAANL